MLDCDFLVCGAGIAGASIAAELAAYAKVIVGEQEEVAGYHTTGRSAAMYILSYGAPAVRRLTAASRAFFENPPTGFADYPLLAPRGCLTIAGPEQVGRLEAEAASLTAGGAPFRQIDGVEAKGLVPVLRSDAGWRCIYEEGSSDIDVSALHQGYLRLARQRGAQLRLHAGIVQMERADGAWRVILADGQTVHALFVINAAGAWADSVARLARAAPLGLTPKRRTAILIEPPAGMAIDAWPNVLDVAEQFYFKPQSGLILASPADETPTEPLDAAPEELDIALCVERIQAVADIPVRRVTRAWAGLRTFAPDHVPVIGFDPYAAGFFWFAGQGGYGMQTAPAAAQLGAALALGGEAPDALGLTATDYAPARFAVSSPNRRA